MIALCLLLVAIAMVSIVAVIFIRLQSNISTTQQVALAACETENFQRAQSNVTGSVSYFVLSASIREISASIPPLPKVGRVFYTKKGRHYHKVRRHARNYKRLRAERSLDQNRILFFKKSIATLVITDFTNCLNATGHPLTYKQPPPMPIGNKAGVASTEAKRIYQKSRHILFNQPSVGQVLKISH